jgi:hypothetical protein
VKFTAEPMKPPVFRDTTGVIFAGDQPSAAVGCNGSASTCPLAVVTESGC